MNSSFWYILNLQLIQILNYIFLFQFLPTWHNYSDTVNVSIVLHNNSGYTSIIYGVLLNSCYWLKENGSTLNFTEQSTPGNMYKRVIKYNGEINNLVKRQQTTFCYYDSIKSDVDCIVDQFGPIYPGQSLSINLKQVEPYSLIAVAPVTFSVYPTYFN